MPSNNSKYYIKKLCCSNKVKSKDIASLFRSTNDSSNKIDTNAGPSTSTSTSSKVDLVSIYLYYAIYIISNFSYLRFYKIISLELNSRFMYQEYLL